MATDQTPQQAPSGASDDTSPDVIVDVQIHETTDWVEFRFLSKIEIGNTAHLFQVLRDSLQSFMGGAFLMIKYASRVHCSNFPVIQDPRSLVCYSDPMLPYRDPAHLFRDSSSVTIRLLKTASSPTFYRKRTQSVTAAKA